MSLTFIKKMVCWKRAGQDLAPHQGGGAAPLLQAPGLAVLRAEVGARPDTTLVELQTVLAEKRARHNDPPDAVPRPTGTGSAVQKNLRYAERDELARLEIRPMTGAFD